MDPILGRRCHQNETGDCKLRSEENVAWLHQMVFCKKTENQEKEANEGRGKVGTEEGRRLQGRVTRCLGS